MRRVLVLTAVTLLASCSDDSKQPADTNSGGKSGGSTAGAGTGATSSMGGAGATSATGGSGSGPGNQGGIVGAAGRGYPDVLDPKDSPPKVGEPGCGLEPAAFCDTFGGASTTRGRAGDLHPFFWSAGRSLGQLSSTRAIGIGLATIPECRPDLPTEVLPIDDTLICQPVFDLESGHLLVAAAAQNYGQNGYRIRQPFDFSGRTGKIVFDASTDPLSPLTGWLSLAITEDPISVPGYTIQSNDEGSILPKNAVEIHFGNSGADKLIKVRFVHVFKNYVDTVYEHAMPASVSRAAGKLNHFEVSVSAEKIEVRMSPHSENGVTFAEPVLVYEQAVSLPMTRGYVQLSLHNHASLKYTQPPNLVNAPVARIDNVGFDGPVITNWREYEIPDALAPFEDPKFWLPPDPKNPTGKGVDIAYVLKDVKDGPAQTLTFKGVDPTDVVSAKLALSIWLDSFTERVYADYVVQARLNGGPWHERPLSAEEAAFFTAGGPTTVDPTGKPLGMPGTQGRLALTIDVPTQELVEGDNTVEFVTSKVPTSYPPLLHNVDLVLQTN